MAHEDDVELRIINAIYGDKMAKTPALAKRMERVVGQYRQGYPDLEREDLAEGPPQPK